MGNATYYLNNQYFIKEISRIEEFERLRPEWNIIAEKQGPYEPFLCFDWFKIWLSHFIDDRKLILLLIYKDKKIRVIAPFLSGIEEIKGVKVKKIELIGNIYSPIRYFLFLGSDCAERIKEASFIFTFFSRFYKDWDIIDMPGIPEEESAHDVMKKAVQEAMLNHSNYFCFGNWYLDGIDYSGDEYLKRRPGNIRENVPVRIRKLKKVGDSEFMVIKNYENIDRHMDSYYALYSKSWQERERVGSTFHRDLAKMAAINGWLRLGFLFLNGSPIGCQFWICVNHYAFLLKLFYDKSYAKYAPGKILAANTIKYLIDSDKVRTIDYVHGDEPYKKDWMPKRRRREGIKIYNTTAKGQYLNFLDNKVLPKFNRNKILKKIKGIILKRVQDNL